jgi:hypothetical protein
MKKSTTGVILLISSLVTAAVAMAHLTPVIITKVTEGALVSWGWLATQLNAYKVYAGAHPVVVGLCFLGFSLVMFVLGRFYLREDRPAVSVSEERWNPSHGVTIN